MRAIRVFVIVATGAGAAGVPQFDVAAVKPSGPNERMSLRVTPGGMFFASYELVPARNGSRLRALADRDCATDTDPPCGGFRFIQRRILIGKSVTLPLLASTLANIVQRTVIDRSGMEGAWNVDLEWDPTDAAGPALFTALEEHAGLRLQPVRGPVEVIVVDRAERPSEN